MRLPKNNAQWDKNIYNIEEYDFAKASQLNVKRHQRWRIQISFINLTSSLFSILVVNEVRFYIGL